MRQEKPLHVICKKCHKSVKMGEFDGSGKRHGHCHWCGIEYHFSYDKGIYSHPYVTNKFRQLKEFGEALREYNEFKKIKNKLLV